MSIKLTENAVREIKQIVSSQEMDIDKTFVRIGIQSMGCSGPSYAFGLDEETDEQDVLLEQDTIKIDYDKKPTKKKMFTINKFDRFFFIC